jgi:hypothetical protein
MKAIISGKISSLQPEFNHQNIKNIYLHLSMTAWGL